ncbi:MAG: hypothetical protein QOG42_951 [Solirubrobacteraceae bacterium]|nr:hypothetical protein [Solirubrobacteraceae bacterium]
MDITVRRRLLISVLLLGLAAVALPAGAAAAPSKCQRLKGRDRAPARTVKLVQRPNADDGTDLVGCVLPRGPLTVIASSADFYTTVESYAIDRILGRIVVIETTSSSQYAYTRALTVHDLRSRTAYTVARSCAMTGGGDCGIGGDSSAPAVLLTRAGRALALVLHGGRATVTAFSTLGHARPLDVGAPADIPPESLTLSGNLASWTNAGVPHSASLVGPG